MYSLIGFACMMMMRMRVIMMMCSEKPRDADGNSPAFFLLVDASVELWATADGRGQKDKGAVSSAARR